MPQVMAIELLEMELIALATAEHAHGRLVRSGRHPVDEGAHDRLLIRKRHMAIRRAGGIDDQDAVVSERDFAGRRARDPGGVGR